MDNTNKTQAKKKKKRLWESSDSETEEKSNYCPSFILMKSAEEIPLSKLSPFKTEKILSKSLKPKTVKKKKKKKRKEKFENGTLLIEICNKNQADKILKWKHFDNIKIKTYPHNFLNTCKGVVKSHELMYIRWNQNQLTRPKCHGNLYNTNKKKNQRNNTYKYIYNDLKSTKFLKKLK